MPMHPYTEALLSARAGTGSVEEEGAAHHRAGRRAQPGQSRRRAVTSTPAAPTPCPSARSTSPPLIEVAQGHHVACLRRPVGRFAGAADDDRFDQSVTRPSMQVTVRPPIQTSSPTRSTYTRPARPQHGALARDITRRRQARRRSAIARGRRSGCRSPGLQWSGWARRARTSNCASLPSVAGSHGPTTPGFRSDSAA